LSILVVGGAGYIGSHAARALRRHGYEVIIYDNLSRGHAFLAAGSELVVADIADGATLSRMMGRVDAVMHFAAHSQVGESVQNPRIYFQNNAEAELRVGRGRSQVCLFLHLCRIRHAGKDAHHGRHASATGKSVRHVEIVLRERARSL
jgi:nucleoside-diphosphate-sugar epimerase